jgi:quinol monooxygenase YgiN
MQASVRVVARFIAAAGKSDELKKVAQALIEPTRKEPGCIRYELLQNQANPADLTFVEEWASGAALDVHMGTPHVQAALGSLPALLGAPPDIQRYNLVA